MKRPIKINGVYSIKGDDYEELFGSRSKVMNGTAYKTTGLLTKKDLMKNKRGYIVSRKKHITASKEKRLEKAGWHTKKGKFGSFKKNKRKGTRKKVSK
jgi:hypothetical protein